MQAHPTTLPAFGAFLAAHGGHFAGIMRGNIVEGAEQPPYALIISPKDAGDLPDLQWGKYGTEVPGCSDRRDGLVNTDAMVKAECPAALRVRELTIHGHSDWYLPALGEQNTAAANVPELFEADGWYWTSTQTSRHLAFAQDFEGGFSLWYGKLNELRARAFRRVHLDALNP